jgi:ribosomal protein L7Ae-like RNA K-turn-binding protein
MKFIKIIMVLCALLAFSKATLMAQNSSTIKIKATVIGLDKQPVVGAIVSSSDEIGKAVTTDALGTFSIEIPKNEVLAIAAKGFKTKSLLTKKLAK